MVRYTLHVRCQLRPQRPAAWRPSTPKLQDTLSRMASGFTSVRAEGRWRDSHGSVPLQEPCAVQVTSRDCSCGYSYFTRKAHAARKPVPDRRNWRRAGAALAVAAALVGSYGVGRAEAAPVRVACQEDAPCWVWSTMGNHRRGIDTVDGARGVIVGPCRFARLYRYIDWSRTDHLRGDATARAAGTRGCKPVKPSSIF